MALPTLTLTPNLDGAVAYDMMTPVAEGFWLAVGPDSLVLPIPEFEQSYAEGQGTQGGRRIASTPKNAVATLKWWVKADNAAGIWPAVEEWEQVLTAVDEHGGVLVYTPEDGTPVSYDVESARVVEMPQENILIRHGRMQATAELVCLPYGRLDPVEIIPAASPESSTSPLMRFDIEDVPGSVEALGRGIFIEPDGVVRDWLEWGACPAEQFPVGAELIDSAAMTPLAGAAAARAGAYGTGDNVIRNSALLPTAQEICETPEQTSWGRLRLRGRLYASGTGAIYVRLRYRIGDAAWRRKPLGWVTVEVLDDFFNADFGVIQVPRSSLGDQSWQARVEVKSDTPGDDFELDYLEVIPAELYGVAEGQVFSETAAPLIAFDTFLQAAGSLSTVAAPLGGNWDEAGDATPDLALSGAPDYKVTRSAVDDVNLDAGQFGILDGSATIDEVSVQADVTLVTGGVFGFTSVGAGGGVLTRFVDADNWVAAIIGAWGVYHGLSLVKCEAGSAGVIGFAAETVPWPGTHARTVRLTVDDAGNAYVFAAPIGSELGAAKITITDADLATGGSLDDGKIGLYDFGVLDPAYASCERTYRNFSASELPATSTVERHVLEPNEELHLRHDSVKRLVADGRASEPLYEGAHLLLPPAGREDRAWTMVAKARRNNLRTGADTPIDDELQASLSVVPRVALLG